MFDVGKAIVAPRLASVKVSSKCRPVPGTFFCRVCNSNFTPAFH